MVGGVVRIAARTRELMVACPDAIAVPRGCTTATAALADVAVGGRPMLIELSV